MERTRRRPRRRRAMEDQTQPTASSSSSHGPNPRPIGTTIHVRQSALYSTRLRKSRGRQEQEPSQNKPVSKECDTAGSETESEVLAEKPKDDSEFDSDEEWRKHREYKEKLLNKDFAPRSTTQAASCDKNSAVEHVTEYSGFAEWAKREYLRWQKSSLVCSQAQHTMVESSRYEPTSEVSDEDIVENANKWMSEEVMVAFNEYIGRNDKLRELKYRFKKLCHQCFNVECYFKIFNHYNFTMEVKLPSSDDWESRTYFAEVKEIFGEPYYFCCPLESDENGKCYACCNQGVNDLMHPATGGFERGLPDNVFPYM
uniref:Uncharacterized protein n=1 Tax=Avena sativa TaxID=4498 RepID=A0ACD5X2R0_AVESA